MKLQLFPSRLGFIFYVALIGLFGWVTYLLGLTNGKKLALNSKSPIEIVSLKADATRIETEDRKFTIEIKYHDDFSASLGVSKGKVIKQRLVRFFDNGEDLGAYLCWRAVGSSIPDSIKTADLKVKPDYFTRVEVVDRFYDVNWRDGRWLEEQLQAWYTQTWHLFNSCEYGEGYYLVDITELPQMDGYLRGCGFTIYAISEHRFSLDNPQDPLPDLP